MYLKNSYAEFHRGHAEFRGEKQRKNPCLLYVPFVPPLFSV
jgi:hypothetical protein